MHLLCRFGNLSLRRAYLFLLFLLFLLSSLQPVSADEKLEYSEERSANFVFLIDVSGSIVSPRTKVTAGDGSKITLFEALRDALKQIVNDERLIGKESKVAFITFGTVVTEKNNWPQVLADGKSREELLARINSPAELEADKHGDTYMAGGLEAAFNKAESLASQSEPCTSTFIIMLTDGWDEPPAGAEYSLKSEAEKYLRKYRELKEKLGVKTWHLRVVGLQRLPDKKEGTTTAAELARIFAGEFIDISKSQSGSVAERIYAALKKTVADLKGQIDLPAFDEGKNLEGIVNFGSIGETPQAKAQVPVWNKSCYVERLNSVIETSKKVKESASLRLLEQLRREGGRLNLPDQGKNLVLVSSLPDSAVQISLVSPGQLLAPVIRNGENAGKASGSVELAARVAASCPPGSYLGFMGFDSTAKVPAFLPYLICIPSRLTIEGDLVKTRVRKPGFIFDRDSSAEISFKVGARVNSSYAGDFDVLVSIDEPSSAQAGVRATLARANFENSGVLPLKVSSSKEDLAVKISCLIPKDTQPGVYRGLITVKCREKSDLVAGTQIPYELEVLPSPWDEMAPVALPMIVILFLLILLTCYMVFIGSRDRI